MIYHVLPEAEAFSDHFGGAFSRWVANVVQKDDPVTIVCPWADKTWPLPSSIVRQIPALRSYGTLKKIMRRELPMALRLRVIRFIFRNLLNELKTGDCVYIHNRPDFVLALIEGCRRRKAKLLLHMQNSHLTQLPAEYLSQLEADAITFCSEFLLQEAKSYLNRIPLQFVVPNGADHKVFFPAFPKSRAPNNTVVLFVGRLVPEKGVHVFMEAMRLLQTRRVPVVGRIVGSVHFGGNTPSRYLLKLKKMRPDNVEFSNYVSGERLANEYRAADIFCCPSVWNEAFGMVNVEAMATRLPVVASKVGGIPEIFQNGGALLVEANSAVQLADAIELLINQPQTRIAIAEVGYNVFSNKYQWSNVRSQYLRMIGALADSPRAAVRQ